MAQVAGRDLMPRQPFRTGLAGCLTAAGVFSPLPAFAHASERGHVLLLPTGYYVAGALVAVLASFLVLALLPPRAVAALWSRKLALGSIPDGRAWTSGLAFMFLCVLVAAGIWGSRDPLANPLPLTVWTLLWIAVTLAQGFFGNVWSWINPWYGPYRLAMQLSGGPGRRRVRPVRSPLAYLPALLGFLAFAWFELVYPAPEDPARLAVVVSAYWLASFLAMLRFGYERWSRYGEFLSAFYAIVARFAPIDGRPRRGRIALSLRWPGAGLMRAQPLPPTGALFLIAALSSVSFDGLSKTFLWLGTFGINPLEYPGRSALVGLNTVGLLVFCLGMAVVAVACVALGERLVGAVQPLSRAVGLLVWSLVPIALAYQASHYVATLLVNGQYAVVALSDPFHRGWNLFGTAGLHVEAAITAGAGGAWLVWNFQSVVIVLGHVLAVLAAHLLAYRLHPDRAAASTSQIPLTVLMLGYTALGLWLLSTPTAG